MTDATGDGSTAVVTAFLRSCGEVLLMRRSNAVGTYSGQWGGVSGFAEGDPDEQVRVEIREETGLEVGEEVSFVRSGEPVRFEDPDVGRTWAVHPYLFDCAEREIELSDEHDSFEWVSPTAMLNLDLDIEREDAVDGRKTVPELWTAYERVAPTVTSIAADEEHGAAVLSIRALAVLRDRAGLLIAERGRTASSSSPRNDVNEKRMGSDTSTRAFDTDPEGEWNELADLARQLLDARPSMAVLRNRVNRTMTEARDTSDVGSATAGAPAVLESTLSNIDRAFEADAAAAANASERIDGTVMTLSRSGTVLDALREGTPSRVFVAESRPDREGIDVAEELATADDVDCPVVVHTDAAVAHVLSREDVDRVVVGADTVASDGSAVNKTGTRSMALAADRDGVPVTVVAATDKISTREAVTLASGDRSAVYDGDSPLDVLNPIFDVTPPDRIDEIVTERGSLEPTDVTDIATEFRTFEHWND